MTDLTERWKKGELPSRDDDHLWLTYYIKHKDGYIHADSLWRGHWGIADRNSIKEILAPVPSYEEWKALNGNMDSVMQTNKALCKKLAELKELLKELFENADVSYCDEDLLTKIDEVLK